jgi:NAD(P)-dependent dehydrogenase (short-subunit alcohol dehydrogenase family)
MAMSEHAFTTGNSFTKDVYRDVYPAVNPAQKSLSKAGKIVMITGASRGIGRDGIAWAFATAGAKVIIITARKVSSLVDTEALIKKTNPSIEVLSLALESTNESSVADAFAQVKNKYGYVDILVNNAGVFNSNGINLSTKSPSETLTWWREFEVNVQGTMLVTKHFLELVGTERPAHLLYASSGAAFAIIPGSSAYNITKLVDLQLASFAAAENPNLTAIAFHPGIVLTDMVDGAPFFKHFAKDTPQLAGAAVNWLASENAKFLTGRYITANWDVTEILARKDEIVEKNLLTIGLTGLTGQTAELRG